MVGDGDLFPNAFACEAVPVLAHMSLRVCRWLHVYIMLLRRTTSGEWNNTPV